MKNLKSILLLILTLTSGAAFSQITGIITNVSVNGVPVPAGEPINMGTNSSVRIKYKATFSKPTNLTIESVIMTPLAYKNNNYSTYYQEIPGNWPLTSNETYYWFEHDIYASNFGFDEDSFLMVELKQTLPPETKWLSNKIKVHKYPIFTSLWHNPSVIQCGSSDPVTFTVNSNDTTYTAYSWNYGTSWQYISKPSNNSIQLRPVSYPLSSVTAIPKIHGYDQATLAKNPILSSFTSNATILGNVVICSGSSSNYSINDLLPGETVVWSSSNPVIASISGISPTQVTVNAISNGTVNLIATITNTCGQTITKTKNLNIGVPIVNPIYNTIIGLNSWYSTNYISPTTATVYNLASATNYVWTITGSPSNANCTDTPKFINGNNTITTYGYETNIDWGGCVGTYMISCNPKNQCGLSYGITSKNVTVGTSANNPADSRP